MKTQRHTTPAGGTSDADRVHRLRQLVRTLYENLCRLDKEALVPLHAAERAGEQALTAADAKAIGTVLKRAATSLATLHGKLTSPLDPLQLDLEYMDLFGEDDA